jgi:hypothetical protein
VSASLRPFVVFGFASVHDTLAAEAVLKTAGIAAVTIPAPRELGELCGIALRVVPSDVELAERALVEGGQPPRARGRIDDL